MTAYTTAHNNWYMSTIAKNILLLFTICFCKFVCTYLALLKLSALKPAHICMFFKLL